MTETVADRLCKRLHLTSSGCWEWLGYCNVDGYGQINIGLGRFLTHRVTWVMVHGQIPKGMKILHICDNPPCCNPAHLWLGTNADNSADMVAKGRAATPGAKLTSNQVEAIRADARIQREIAIDYGITRQNVSLIKRGEIWGG